MKLNLVQGKYNKCSYSMQYPITQHSGCRQSLIKDVCHPSCCIHYTAHETDKDMHYG